MSFYDNLFVHSFGTLVSSESQSDIVVRLTSSLCCLLILLVYLNFASCLACLSSKLASKYLIALEIVVTRSFFSHKVGVK